MLHRFAGDDVEPDLLDDQLRADDTVEGLLARNHRIWQRVDATVAAGDLDAVGRRDDDEANPDLRWVLAHLVEEVARHAGHADILREGLDGSTGVEPASAPPPGLEDFWRARHETIERAARAASAQNTE